MSKALAGAKEKNLKTQKHSFYLSSKLELSKKGKICRFLKNDCFSVINIQTRTSDKQTSNKGNIFWENTRRRSETSMQGSLFPLHPWTSQRGLEELTLSTWSGAFSSITKKAVLYPTYYMTRDQDTLGIQSGRTLAPDLSCRLSI